MAHHFSFTVNVTVERTEGKFASRDELEEAIMSSLEYANEGSIDGVGNDGNSNYEIVDWEVSADA